jgi:low affinity Fe/Cu permease
VIEMNERIQELIREAESTTNEGIGFEGQEYLDMLMERFAQLIVRECAEVCLAQRDPANLNYKPSEKFAEAVKEHFGVEE